MGLQALPTELLAQIIEDIEDPYFFQKKIRRLTVCKSWYGCAQDAMFAQFLITPTKMNRLSKLPLEVRKRVLSRMKLVRRLDVILENPLGNKSPKPWELGYIWNMAAAEGCAGVVASLKEANAVRELRVLVHYKFKKEGTIGNLGESLHNCMVSRDLPALLDTLSLNVLELDLRNLVGATASADISNAVHLCPYISRLLTRRLTRFRLRCSRLCPEAFPPPHQLNPKLKEWNIIVPYIPPQSTCTAVHRGGMFCVHRTCSLCVQMGDLPKLMADCIQALDAGRETVRYTVKTNMESYWLVHDILNNRIAVFRWAHARLHWDDIAAVEVPMPGARSGRPMALYQHSFNHS